MRQMFIGLAFAICTSHAAAAVVDVGTATSTISKVYTYADGEGTIAGSVIVDVTDPLNVSTCRGGWITKSDSQYQEVLQLLTAAKLTRSLVRVIADDSRLFPGSSDKYCYIHVAGLQ